MPLFGTFDLNCWQYTTWITSYYCAAAAFVAVAALLIDAIYRQVQWTNLVVAVFLLMIHPAWTIEAGRSDGGLMKRNACYFVTGVFILLLFNQYLDSDPIQDEDSE